MAVVNASGAVQDSYTYDVYGTPTKTGSLANEFDFAGQQTDGTGLQYLRARYYDPATGTFLSREPMANAPTWSENPSGYADGSPARFADPTGLFPIDACEPDCGTAIDFGDEFGLSSDKMWLEQYLDKNGKLNIHACGFKTAGGPEIAGVECSSGIFDGGFDIFIGEYCSLSFDGKEQNFALACSRRGSDAAPETRATAHVDAPNGSSPVDLCAEGAIATIILAKGAGGPQGWAIEAGTGCAAGILAHLIWDNVKPW